MNININFESMTKEQLKEIQSRTSTALRQLKQQEDIQKIFYIVGSKGYAITPHDIGPINDRFKGYVVSKLPVKCIVYSYNMETVDEVEVLQDNKVQYDWVQKLKPKDSDCCGTAWITYQDVEWEADCDGRYTAIYTLNPWIIFPRAVHTEEQSYRVIDKTTGDLCECVYKGSGNFQVVPDDENEKNVTIQHNRAKHLVIPFPAQNNAMKDE